MTSHLSMDVAAIPLLWVVPLAVYLGSFVVAFARSTRVPPRTRHPGGRRLGSRRDL